MSKMAYDMYYYDSMLQKTRYLFKLIARNTDEPFRVVRDYMKSDYRRAMDWENPLYLSKTPKQNLGSFEISINFAVVNPFYITGNEESCIDAAIECPVKAIDIRE